MSSLRDEDDPLIELPIGLRPVVLSLNPELLPQFTCVETLFANDVCLLDAPRISAYELDEASDVFNVFMVLIEGDVHIR